MSKSKVHAKREFNVVVEGDRFVLYGNDKAIVTPRGHRMDFSNMPIAITVAEEWKNAENVKLSYKKPMTQLTQTVLDIIPVDRDLFVQKIMAYAETELLCYRALEPESLVQKQTEIWQPILDWFELLYKVKFHVARGVMPITQNPEIIMRLKNIIKGFEDWKLGGLSAAVEASGSFILGLALLEKKLTAQNVFEIAEVESLFQSQQWGPDPALAGRHEKVIDELRTVEKWFELQKN